MQRKMKCPKCFILFHLFFFSDLDPAVWLTSGNITEFPHNPPSSSDMAPWHQALVRVPSIHEEQQ